MCVCKHILVNTLTLWQQMFSFLRAKGHTWKRTLQTVPRDCILRADGCVDLYILCQCMYRYSRCESCITRKNFQLLQVGGLILFTESDWTQTQLVWGRLQLQTQVHFLFFQFESRPRQLHWYVCLLYVALFTKLLFWHPFYHEITPMQSYQLNCKEQPTELLYIFEVQKRPQTPFIGSLASPAYAQF